MKLSILLVAGALAAASQAQAGVAYFNGSLTSANPTFQNPNGSSSGQEYYAVYTITVDTNGSYTFETASPNTSTSGTSNALDTNILLYTSSFNPATPSSPAATATNDDFTGTLTVLPGPYAPLVSSTATGYQNAQPSSRFTASLTAGTTYYFIESSFRQVGYVNTNDGAATGDYYAGISGPGNITVTPAPASAALMGLGGLMAARRRRR